VVAECPGVPRETARKLSGLVLASFRQHEQKVAKDVMEAGPRV
jgi:hypothetical protein